tara:strand:- start:471 stop:617 length:147 start_codon:yes stop_codon:yes gene_type:complete
MTLAGQTVFIVWLHEDYCYSGKVYSSREAIPGYLHNEDYAQIKEVVIQ